MITDTRACEAEGRHVKTTRHLPASCPFSDQTLPRVKDEPDAAACESTGRHLLTTRHRWQDCPVAPESLAEARELFRY
jgi:hypothetical protein